MSKYSDIKFENREEVNGIVIQEGTPVPPEIAQYYTEHGYLEKGIPLNANTCKEIAELL